VDQSSDVWVPAVHIVRHLSLSILRQGVNILYPGDDMSRRPGRHCVLVVGGADADADPQAAVRVRQYDDTLDESRVHLRMSAKWHLTDFRLRLHTLALSKSR
jgi:hypothetical protein